MWILVLHLTINGVPGVTLTSWFDTGHDCVSARVQAQMLDHVATENGLRITVAADECRIDPSQHPR